MSDKYAKHGKGSDFIITGLFGKPVGEVEWATPYLSSSLCYPQEVLTHMESDG